MSNNQERRIPENIKYFFFRYFGHKGFPELLKAILSFIPKGTKTLAEPFGGTGIISWVVKQFGIRVVINDILRCAHLRHRVFVENNTTTLAAEDIRILNEPNKERGDSAARLYGHILGPGNSAYLDNYISNIPKLANPTKRDIAVLLPILCCLQHLKFDSYSFTAYGGLTGFQHLWDVPLRNEVEEFARDRLPRLVYDNGKKNEAYQEDAVSFLPKINADVAVIDSPYCGAPASEYESQLALTEDWVRVMQGRAHEIKNRTDCNADLPPYTDFVKRGPALMGLAALLERSDHIPILIMSWNSSCGVHTEELSTLVRMYREIKATRRIPRPIPNTTPGKRYTHEILIVAERKNSLTRRGR